MHSRRQPKYTRSNFSIEEDDDNNAKNASYSKLISYILGALLCFSLGSQAYSSGFFSSGTVQNTPDTPSFIRAVPLPSMVQYEDFPDISVQDVQAKALALLHSGGNREEEEKLEEEKEREQQRREEEEEEAKFLKEQALMEAEQAFEKQKKKLATKNINNQNNNHNEGEGGANQLSHDALVEDSLRVAKEQIAELRMMKYDSHIVMETDHHAQERIQAAQSAIRKFLILKHGSGPYYVKMVLKFPDSMMHEASSSSSAGGGGLKGSNSNANAAGATPREEEIVIELAPIDYVPYSVYMFLENIVNGYKSGAFHRNAGHVLQAMVTVQDAAHHNYHESFAWQEYSPHYPHVKYTLGYAGRPSSNGAFYISTMDNARNHGPASQGSKTEADSIIGRIFKGEDVVRRMCKQPNKGGNGFIKSPEDYIKILSLELMHT